MVRDQDVGAPRAGLAWPSRARRTPDFAEVWIHGAGSFGRRIARELRRLGWPVRGFVDRKAPREAPFVDGLPCRHPDALPHDVGGAHCVHGIMNDASALSAVAWSTTRGFRSVLFPADLYAVPGFRLANYWLSPPDLVLAQRAAIEHLHERLDDEESRAVLAALLAYRLSTDPRVHPPVSSDPYLPSFLPLFEEPITFVDGGAYTGDTMEALLARGVAIADWLAFEPDERNMRALRATAHAHRARLGGFTLLAAGLSNANGLVRFAGGSGLTSRIVEADGTDGPLAPGGGEASTEIPVVRLDDVAFRGGPVYVKLDVEGAEAAALEGMAGLLAGRPTLAVSVYHRPADLWEIPLLIADLYERPRLRMRQHGHNGFDTVLYVVPDGASDGASDATPR